MEKEYNLSALFEEGEFDAQKGYNHYGSKEAYFSVLYRFTLDSEKILRTCRLDQYDDKDIDVKTLSLCAVRLQGLLASIGAINLAWSIQRMTSLLIQNHYTEFLERFREALLHVDRLRKRIINAEKVNGDSERTSEHSQKEKTISNQGKHSSTLWSGDFERLLMLIDNFELESASKIASSIMRQNYSADIDKTLTSVAQALKGFDFPGAVKDAQVLLGLVKEARKAEKPEKKNILAIDDMPSVLITLEAMLKDKYNVFCMTDYDSAVKYLCSNTADLILLDIEMPGIDGFAMVQLFRGLPEYKKTPILFLTGSVSDDHIRMAANLGVRDFIKKPVDLTVLHHKMENALSNT